MKEHLDGLFKSKACTPLGAHRSQRHENAPIKTAVTILAYEPEILAGKTFEAFWISARNPKMNRKEECISVINELAPYQVLCGFCSTGSDAGGTYLLVVAAQLQHQVVR
ncbi:hypothetical protein Y032_0050g2046 [Ancylostoma ceylanicum]|uniref:Uncharacterized protein n=1 Tax=Ancylostoma ceylanicum TaxID=53326 RepID=A0A016U961_9BILA|nr:hypothetical protein Y032_0050g2046 [Ancylostoma ceylanicum]